MRTYYNYTYESGESDLEIGGRSKIKPAGIRMRKIGDFPAAEVFAPVGSTGFTVGFRYPDKDSRRLVEVVISCRDRLLKNCLDSVKDITDYFKSSGFERVYKQTEATKAILGTA